MDAVDLLRAVPLLGEDQAELLLDVAEARGQIRRQGQRELRSGRTGRPQAVEGRLADDRDDERGERGRHVGGGDRAKGVDDGVPAVRPLGERARQVCRRGSRCDRRDWQDGHGDGRDEVHRGLEARSARRDVHLVVLQRLQQLLSPH